MRCSAVRWITLLVRLSLVAVESVAVESAGAESVGRAVGLLRWVRKRARMGAVMRSSLGEEDHVAC